jgi:hypothetical protein
MRTMGRSDGLGWGVLILVAVLVVVGIVALTAGPFARSSMR